MRLKTYLSTYLLFLAVLFLCFGIVSAYMTSSQINMYAKKCEREYETIAQTLYKDISTLASKEGDFAEDVIILVDGYAAYYKRNNIFIGVTDLSLSALEDDNNPDIVISFFNRDGEHYIHVTGVLSKPFEFYRLDYQYNMTEHIADMRNIQNILLLICIGFSIITAFILYFVLSGIFKPLSLVSRTTIKIADGHYDERIPVKGSNELAVMAQNFNRMAEEMENQIRLLAEEVAAKQRFIDNFAHEIRTPLTSIYGNAEYMQKAPLEEGEVVEYTQAIMDKTNHIKQIANLLLQLATLRDYKLVKNKVSIPQLFDEVSKTVKKSTSEKEVKIISKSEVDYLEGQEDLLKSLFLNLCFNALKACPPVGGVISLVARGVGHRTEVSVTDNGCGIPEESLPKITEPFYQVDKARSYGKGSVGLGLTLCKQIAEAHGAVLSIESAVGVGTTVKITFTSS